MAAQRGYWHQQMSGELPVLNLPTDRPRPAVQTSRGKTETFVLPRELSASLERLSQAEGTTLFMTLLATFQTLLHRYSGQEDIIVGTPIAGRNRAEIEGLIGFFVNTLALRIDLTGGPSFRELLGRVREVALGAYAHQDLPFEQLIEDLNIERDLSRNPLFQVMFVLQNAPQEKVELADVTLSGVELESTIAKFDLTLTMMETEQGLIGAFEYNTDLFNHEHDHADDRSLQHPVDRPHARRDAASLRPADDDRRGTASLTILWNERIRALQPVPESCVHELFETQAAMQPDAIAVVFRDEQLTYRELNERANRLAHRLQKAGVGPETLVGLFVERSMEMVVGALAINKAGGAYVPIDTSYPTDRIATIFETAEPRVVITQTQLLSRLPETTETQMEIVCVDEEQPVAGADRPIQSVM